MKRWESPFIGKRKVLIRVTLGRFKTNPQKAVLPAITYISVNHPKYREFNQQFTGRLVSVGWWDWSINIGIYWSRCR